MSKAHLLRNATDRALYGVTTTWKNDAGKTFSLYRSGPPRRALSETVAVVEQLDPSFRLTGYSTPETIYDDLNGRMPTRKATGYDVQKAPPELFALAGIGRQELIDPRLARG